MSEITQNCLMTAEEKKRDLFLWQKQQGTMLFFHRQAVETDFPELWLRGFFVACNSFFVACNWKTLKKGAVCDNFNK